MTKNKHHWTFLTNHSQVLLCIALRPQITTREIAEQIGITERAVQRIVADLETANYLSHQRRGRKNFYSIHRERPMRHKAQEGLQVKDLLDLIAPLARADYDREAEATAETTDTAHEVGSI